MHDLYLAIQTDATLSNPDRLRMEDDSYYLKSAAEMAALFPDLPAALDNSLLIAQDCNVELDFGRKHLPAFPAPDGMNADQYLSQLCQDGFRRLCPADDARYRERLNYELEVVRQTGFADYFLIVWDIISFARRNWIQFGVRGSAAASLALYCLDITVADPIRRQLVFERFLNLERKEMPDIDMDFQDDRRDEVMNYVTARYHATHVGQIVTFSRFGVKSTIRAAARAMEIPYQTADRIARAAPAKSPTIGHALENGNELQSLASQDPKIKTLLEHAQGLEGVVHHTGSHAAGVVIASEPLNRITPLQPPTAPKDAPDGAPILNLTQYSLKPIARLGLLKMDFLGLTSLTILDQAMKLVPDGPEQLADLPLDDADTYQLLGSGNTSNVFQLESDGIQRYIRELKPGNLGRHCGDDRPLPPRPYGQYRPFYPLQTRAGTDCLSPPQPERPAGRNLRRHRLSGPSAAYTAKFRRLQHGRSRHRAQGDGQENPRADAPGTAAVRRHGATERPYGHSRQRDLRHHRTLRRLRFQQSPQRQLRPHQLLDCLVQNPPPGCLYDRLPQLSAKSE